MTYLTAAGIGAGVYSFFTLGSGAKCFIAMGISYGFITVSFFSADSVKSVKCITAIGRESHFSRSSGDILPKDSRTDGGREESHSGVKCLEIYLKETYETRGQN